MAEYNVVCPTCDTSFIAKRKDQRFCKRWCYRNDPIIKAKYRVRTDAYRNKLKYDPYWRFNRLESKCKSKNYELNLDLETFTALLNKGCHYCFSDLSKETGCGLDRVDNNFGYSINNVVPCCGKCNQIRNIHLTKEEMEVAMRAVLDHREQLT